MSKRKISKEDAETYSDDDELSSSENDDDNCVLLQSDDSDIDGCTDDEDSSEEEIPSSSVSYRTVTKSYTSHQKKLKENHVFSRVEGEKIHDTESLENETYLTKKVKKKKKIRQSTPVELFELFFTEEMKTYIIDATAENGLEMSMEEFIGIILVTSYNIRTDQREYWSTNPFLKCEMVSSAMSRNRFLTIKSKIKYWKEGDQNQTDKAWRVRKIIIFSETTYNSSDFSLQIFPLMR